MNKKVLIITYYWPPAGGAGVQRWVKLSRYLKSYNIDPYVITVREDIASYMQIDRSLEKDVSPEIKVYKTRSFEPIKLYEKVMGKSRVPTAGFSNVDNKNFGQRVINSLRSNLFIPDPRRGWNRFAYRKAANLIRREKIGIVITTSPPHSTQLIGAKLKKHYPVKWIADLRDPWTDIYYYDILGHTAYSRKRDLSFERGVITEADGVFTVSKSLKELFLKKTGYQNPEKYHIVPNGYDPADFDHLKKRRNKDFTIVYTGSMAENYAPEVFFQTIAEIFTLDPAIKINLQFIGQISTHIKHYISKLNLNIEYISSVPHDEVIQYQKNADLLLLIIPDVEHAAGILTGKLFEYLATGNPILCIGPEDGDAAGIIRNCESGSTFLRRNKKQILEYIKGVYWDARQGSIKKPKWSEIQKYSRLAQAEELDRILADI